MIDPLTSTTVITLAASQTAMAWSLVIAGILGALLGLERSVAGKHAGMRTYALVSSGSCLFVLVGSVASRELLTLFPGVNPVQIAASIVIGIGFIGSGLVSIKNDTHAELTTASGIWVVAGIGMACGYGLYLLALVATVLAAAILTLFLKFENGIRKKYGHDPAV